MKTYKIIGLFVSLLIMSSVDAEAQRRELKAYLFPYLPHQDTYYNNLERAFEAINTDIDLKITLDEENYYDGGLLKAEADVYEIDCIFLDDMVKQNRIAPFPDQAYLADKDTLNYDGVHSVGNSLYAIPHWLCSYFMIYHKDDAALRDAIYLRDIERVLGKDRGVLMMSVHGGLSAGSAYIDGLRDDRKAKAEISTALAATTLDNVMMENMKRLLQLTKKNGVAQPVSINRFISGDARAYVTYAETINSVLDSINAGSHIKKDDVMIRDWPLSDNGSRPLGWVDALAVKQGLDAQQKEDAQKLIEFMVSKDGYHLALLPKEGESPRYLLPPYKSYYQDAQILDKAPLYNVLFNLVSNFGPLKLPQVTNDEIIKVGNKVAQELQIDQTRSLRKGHPGR